MLYFSELLHAPEFTEVLKDTVSNHDTFTFVISCYTLHWRQRDWTLFKWTRCGQEYYMYTLLIMDAWFSYILVGVLLCLEMFKLCLPYYVSLVVRPLKWNKELLWKQR